MKYYIGTTKRKNVNFDDEKFLKFYHANKKHTKILFQKLNKNRYDFKNLKDVNEYILDYENCKHFDPKHVIEIMSLSNFINPSVDKDILIFKNKKGFHQAQIFMARAIFPKKLCEESQIS